MGDQFSPRPLTSVRKFPLLHRRIPRRPLLYSPEYQITQVSRLFFLISCLQALHHLSILGRRFPKIPIRIRRGWVLTTQYSTKTPDPLYLHTYTHSTMRLLSLHALALLCCGVAVAQDCINVALTAIPACAQNCILNGAPSIGCQGTDFSCQCAQSAALYAAVEGCVSSACPSASYQAVIDGSDEVCGCAAPAGGAVAAAGTASVSGIGGSSIPATNSATATSAAAPSATSGGGGSGGGSGTTGGAGAGGGSGGTPFTGYSSVSPIATASVIGAAAQATPGLNVIRYVVPAVVIGAAVL